MKQITAETYLAEALMALVRFYGIDRLKQELDTISKQCEQFPAPTNQQININTARPPKQKSLPKVITEISEREPEKGKLLENFFQKIVSASLLPEAEDVRRFADLVGIKKLKGKSRNELITKLANELVPLDLRRLENLLPQADGISSAQRREGYSILTDTLMQSTKRQNSE